MSEYIQGVGIVLSYDGKMGMIRGPMGYYKFYRTFVRDNADLWVGCQVFFKAAEYSLVAFFVKRWDLPKGPESLHDVILVNIRG